ncbi:MAG TPA: sn-glycerol-3-phosphate ABC transporter permease UgpE [Burkholderiaceae bacterium]|nr:sn-glycerol-3-phosphate ABC transporter permease UgpE [Burkholderiaceae bacterium]
MRDRFWMRVLTYLVLLAGVAVIALPVWVAFVASTQTLQQVMAAPMSLLPGDRLIENYAEVLRAGAGNSGAPVARMLANSLFMAMVIALGKIAISLIAAFALIYFRFPMKTLAFWLIFVTLMLPVEVRILPTYEVMAKLRLIDTYTGLTLPLIASATATFLFRQFFMTVPDELAEAAKIDGAGPMHFFWHILFPLSRTNIAALFVILFVYGWNQYLWPLLVTTQESMYPVVIGIKRMIAGGDAATEWHLVMATAMLAMLPPLVVVVAMQHWFVKGLVDADK